MKRLILLAAFVFALPAHGSTEVLYLGHHPSGGCRWVFRKDAAQFIEFGERKLYSPDVEENVWLVHKKNKYILATHCSRDPRHKSWEQELADVQEIKGKSVIYIPKQKMVDGSTFGGDYWCVLPKQWISRVAHCTKEGWVKR